MHYSRRLDEMRVVDTSLQALPFRQLYLNKLNVLNAYNNHERQGE